MDKSEYVQKRRKRYLAQTLDVFEERILPLLPETATAEVNQFKATVRQKFNALAVDCCELIELGDNGALNGLGIEQKDKLFPGGRTR